MRRALDVRSAWVAAWWYLVLTCVMTWPLVTGLAHDLPGDLGDSLLNGWILAWTADHLLAWLGGDLGALADYWHANIFAPEPYTLAYSEHLTALTLQMLPVYALTGNVVLGYNLLFLSQFVLSGLGVYLLVRHLTGQPAAAFVAGLLYAFAPYRIAQVAHLQVLASQWMPFVLYGYRVYFDTGRRRALAWGTLALVAQNLSCGYYLLFFAPIVVFYVLYELADRGRLRDRGTWRDILAAAVAAGAATVPFLIPYLRLKQHLGFVRSLDEVVSYSADVHAYATASGAVRLWRDVPFFKAENELFPGFVPIVLAAAGVALLAHAAWRHAGRGDRDRPVWRSAIAPALGAVVALHGVAIVLILIYRSIGWSLGPIPIHLRSGDRWLVGLVISAAAWLFASPRARRWLRGVPGSLGGFAVTGAIACAWLSFGPIIQSLGRTVAMPALYLPLYLFVPGFEGLRVPARYGMLVFLMLAVLGGYALARLAGRGRAGVAAVLACGLLFLVEGNALPFPTNRIDAEPGYATPEPLDPVPAIYESYARLPPDAVVLELPIGSPGYDLRSVYYSRLHHRRLINGYSGMFPDWYGSVVAAFNGFASDPDGAWSRLNATAATHVMVRTAAYRGGRGAALEAWLEGHGARLVARAGTNALYAFRPHPSLQASRASGGLKPATYAGCSEEQDRRPRSDRGDEIQRRQQHHHPVDLAQVEEDAQAGGERFRGGERRAGTQGDHQLGEKRVRLDAVPERHHAHVGQHAVEALHEQEREQRHVPEQLAARLPRLHRRSTHEVPSGAYSSSGRGPGTEVGQARCRSSAILRECVATRWPISPTSSTTSRPKGCTASSASSRTSRRPTPPSTTAASSICPRTTTWG